MTRLAAGLVGAFVEAWQEVRIHRTRVALSLVGVAVAVCALTTVIALGAILQQATTEMNERQSGRPATLYVSIGRADGEPVDQALLKSSWQDIMHRYQIQYSSRNEQTTIPVDSTSGVIPVPTRAVDQPYGAMHRVRVVAGAWFSPADQDRLAPAIVINQAFWERIGKPAMSTRPTVSLGGYQGVTAIIVGVTPSGKYETESAMYVLAGQLDVLRSTDAGLADTSGAPRGRTAQYELWVPSNSWEQLAAVVQRDLRGALGSGATIEVSRQDADQYGDGADVIVRLVIGGTALLVLLLGALGLVNIAIVTVRHRVREIGIRRSFGATADRVFFAVMLESVVATSAAGVVGVAGGILIVQSPLARSLFEQGQLVEFPAFPLEAALLGLLAAISVGALAGIIPALIAVRVKVIDAIRY